jgi:hypothetical protein
MEYVMARSTSPAADHAVLLSARVSGEYLTLRGEAVSLEDGQPRNLRADDYRVNPLAGLTITAQADRKSDLGESYAWRLGLTSSETMRSDQVAATLATLRAVERRLDADHARYGTARTFGEFLGRVLAALRVPAIVGRTGADGFYNSGNWTLYPSGEAAGLMADTLARYHRTGNGPEYWR